MTAARDDAAKKAAEADDAAKKAAAADEAAKKAAADDAAAKASADAEAARAADTRTEPEKQSDKADPEAAARINDAADAGRKAEEEATNKAKEAADAEGLGNHSNPSTADHLRAEPEGDTGSGSIGRAPASTANMTGVAPEYGGPVRTA